MRWRRWLRVMVSTATVVAVAIPSLAAAATVWSNGLTVHSIRSGSMAPGIPRGSVAISAPVDTTEIAPGSVIVFTDPRQPERTVVHRVRTVVEQPGGVFFETQGDANSSPDLDLVPARLVQGRVENRIMGVGAVADRLSDRTTGVALVVGALLLFVSSEALGVLTRRRGRLASLRAERDALLVRITELETTSATASAVATAAAARRPIVLRTKRPLERAAERVSSA